VATPRIQVARDGAGALPPVLPDGTRLLHIGPPKTGTTSLQGAFWAARDAALAQGVRYAGSSRHSSKAVLAATGRVSFAEDRATPDIGHWHRLLREIREAREPRVVLSSEGFSYASDEARDRVVTDLDASRLHVVVTLRPIPNLLASEWQEHTQSGLRVPFEDWLDELFNQPDSRIARAFWHRQRHDRLIERWAEPVGIDRVTAVVVDERDHGRLYRVFEALTGLAEGTLVPDSALANRSLTLQEITAIRALAERFDAEGLSMPAFHRVARMKLAAYMKQRRPGPDEARIETPQWALDRAGEIGREVVAGIIASGARVIGDLESLAVVPHSGLEGDRLPEVTVTPEIAAWMAMGAIVAGNLAAPGGARAGGGASGDLASVPSRRLARILAGRARRSVTRRLGLRRP
jgi:hypothetical protein